jgi:hypothetical protein
MLNVGVPFHFSPHLQSKEVKKRQGLVTRLYINGDYMSSDGIMFEISLWEI